MCYERCETCDNYPECKECLKDDNGTYFYHFIYNEKGKCIKQEELKEGFYYLDNNDNTYKLCPEGTSKIDNNQCIEDSIEAYIIIIIIFIIILLIIVLFCIWRIISKKRRKDNLIEKNIEYSDMKELN